MMKSQALLTIIAVVLLGGCANPAPYKKTFEQAEQALAAKNTSEAKRLAKAALQEAESANAGCNGFYDTTTTFLLHLPETSVDEQAAILQHSIDVAEKSKNCSNRDAVLSLRYHELGSFCRSNNLDERAAQSLQLSLDKAVKLKGGADYCELFGIRDNRGPHDHITYPTSLYAEVATAHEKVGKFTLAEPLRRKDLSVHEKFFGPNGDIPRDLDEGGINKELCALAGNLAGQGQFDEAEKLYKRSIDVNEHNRKAHVPKSFELSHIEYAGLGEIYRKQDRHSESEQCFVRAIKGFEDHPMIGQVGHTDPLLWQTRLNYAQLLKQMGRNEEAVSIENQVADSKAAEKKFWNAKSPY